MWGWPSSLRARLTCWYTVLVALPLIVFAIACYSVVARTLERRTDIFIGDALTAFARELNAERRAAGSTSEAMQRTVNEVSFRDLHIAILGPQRQVVAMSELATDDAASQVERRPSANIEARLLDSLRQSSLPLPFSTTIATRSDAFRVVARAISANEHTYTLIGAYSLRDIDDVLQRVRQLFVLAIPLLLVTAALGGYLLARRSLAPVASMAAQAAEISASTMSARLPVTGGDELVGLARVFNGLLDRLEATFERQRRFITEASHELRTPTAVVRAEADVTLSRPHRTEDEYRASVVVIRDAAQRLTRIVDDLFLLSRADSGQLVVRRSPLYLEEVVHNATRAVQSVAIEKHVDVVFHDVVDAPLEGDADLLGRLMLNLLDNAIKYAPAYSTVDVAMSSTATGFGISVIDAGPGIPASEQERVFERFVRLDSARVRSESSTMSGAGLGLAIARRIADLHGGTLRIVDSRPGRTEFGVFIPRT